MARVARAVAIALGSNLGDRHAHLHHAISELQSLLDDLRVSTVIETAPVDTPDPQASYLNAAAVGMSADSPRTLLERLLAIERQRGRARPYVNAPRTLDLDLVLCGEEIVAEPGLTVPHPRFRERRFVLEPLAEIAPELIDPVSGLTISALLARCPGS